MAFGQDHGEAYLIHHQMVSLKKSIAKKFGVKSLQVKVSLFEEACILRFQGETFWSKNKLRAIRGLWPGSWGALSKSPSNGISLKKSHREVWCEIIVSGCLFI